MGTIKLLKLMSVAATIMFMSTAQSQTVNVTGKYIYHNDSQSPLSDLTVKLVNQTNQVVATTLTNRDGIYSFTNVPVGEYSIKATTDKPSHGYTMQDCYELLMHVSGFLPLDNIQLLAADVDNNNIVDRNDLNLMVAAWANPTIKFASNKNWMMGNSFSFFISVPTLINNSRKMMKTTTSSDFINIKKSFNIHF